MSSTFGNLQLTTKHRPGAVTSSAVGRPKHQSKIQIQEAAYMDGLFRASSAATSRAKAKANGKGLSPCVGTERVSSYATASGTQEHQSVLTERSQRNQKSAKPSSACAGIVEGSSSTKKRGITQQSQSSGLTTGARARDDVIMPVTGNKCSVRRYALYRSMLRSSQIVENDVSQKRKESKFENLLMSTTNEHSASTPRQLKSSVSSALSEDTRPSPQPAWDRVQVESETVHTEDLASIPCDLRGTELPKRIYIREVVNGAIIDELVDVRNRREWEILTYMSPLRPLRPAKFYTKKSRDISFPDLKDFQIYYFAIPWK